ncbi:cation diffusion facilitator family transporter [Oceaniglobus roseus]|uniref:cation diffusion facilitator family transporter n=1 Tax=Oceaniglobus roseus TaxID=1737570 RepID=UPI000C7EF83A|nr:cation diffusion facilitator family transporter [Kandeliimicrobium roseum]
MSGSDTSKDGGGDGKATVIAALAANCGIAVTKFVAAAFSGSSAMLAEGIHSVIDTGNQGFLLLGMARAKQPADDRHPFGYGAEIYFWAFVVAVMLFALGSGLSIYEGVRALLHGESEHNEIPWIPFAVLGIALCFEGYSLSVAIREFRESRKHRGLLRDLQDMKDPSVFVVLAEDTAACIGLVIAAVGLALSWLTGNPVWDAGASILIGILLGCTAFFLAIEVKGLLVGEGTDPDVVEGVREIIGSPDEIIALNEIRTLHFGPRDVLVTVSVDFRDNVNAGKIERMVTEAEARIKERFPVVRRVFLEVQSREGHERMAAQGGD